MGHGAAESHNEHHEHQKHEEKNHDHNDHGNEEVEIIIDDKPWPIHRGSHSVSDLKSLAGIPLAYDLDKITDGKFLQLPDDGKITIKGGEVFISHPKDGSSS